MSNLIIPNIELLITSFQLDLFIDKENMFKTLEEKGEYRKGSKSTNDEKYDIRIIIEITEKEED